jgi:hypothetical protein
VKPESYEAYLKGRYFLDKRLSADSVLFKGSAEYGRITSGQFGFCRTRVTAPADLLATCHCWIEPYPQFPEPGSD